MKKSLKIFIIIFTIIFVTLCMLGMVFLVPQNIPLLFNVHEEIITLCSKYLLIVFAAMPLLFCLALLLAKNSYSRFLAGTIYYLSIYELTMILLTLIASKNLELGQIIEIPLTCFIFLPLSFVMLFWGLKLKSVPYKCKFGINLKITHATEFIWKQSHYYASRVISITGLMLAIVSIIFAFFHLSIVLLGAFIIAAILDISLIYSNSKKMYSKYTSLKDKSDKLNNKK